MEVTLKGLELQNNFIFPKEAHLDLNNLDDLVNAQIVEPNSNLPQPKPLLKRNVSKLSLLPNKRIYVGDIQNNVPHGYGEATYPNKCSYKGYWINGERCGKGTTYRSNGTKNYEGEWKHDKPNGLGAVYRKIDEAKICEGEWKDGSFIQH
jgi:hypothetical protein